MVRVVVVMGLLVRVSYTAHHPQALPTCHTTALHAHTSLGFRPSLVYAARAVAAGGRHSLVLLRNGGVWATGENEYGQLGDGTFVNKKHWVYVVRMGKSDT